MNSIKSIRFVGGFARAGSVTPEEYLSAKPDPISAFADPVMKHMNEDHADSTQAMIQHYVGIPCTDAKIVNLDRLGMTVSELASLIQTFLNYMELNKCVGASQAPFCRWRVSKNPITFRSTS